MTMVVVGKFKEGAIAISDSRASYLHPNGLIPNDSLQKILPIGRERIFCYSGSVSIVNRVLYSLKELNSKKKQFQYLDGIVGKLSGLLKSHFMGSSRGEKNQSLAVIVGGKLVSGDIQFWTFKAPNFQAIPMDKFEVIGSGSVVRDYLEREVQNIDLLPDIKAKADALLHGLSSELSRHGVESVGGMFQIFIVSDKGIQPFYYGHIDLDPEGIPDSMSMAMENGVWIQRDLAKGKEVPIVSPDVLLSRPPLQIKILENTGLDGNKKTKKWHLNYFMTCAEVNIPADSIEFHIPTVIGQAAVFPLKFKTILSIGFWGSAGPESLVISLESKGHQEIIDEIPFDISYFPEDIDIAKEVEITVTEPGIVFLEARIKDKVIGRRALFFGEIKAGEMLSMMQNPDVVSRVMEEAKEKLVGQVDPVVEGGKPELVYSFLCQGYRNEDNVEVFENRFWVVYWKQYPLPLKCYIASAFRLATGAHNVRIDLVDAASHGVISNITNTSLVSRSSSLVSPIHGGFIIDIPQPGYYYVNTYVDDGLITTSILIAENDRPMYSYSLLPDQQEEVEDGQLLLLSKKATRFNGGGK